MRMNACEILPSNSDQVGLIVPLSLASIAQFLKHQLLSSKKSFAKIQMTNQLSSNSESPNLYVNNIP